MNKVKIMILENNQLMNNFIPLDKALEYCCGLRTARKAGDIETINHTQLGKLKDNRIKFKILK